jgi:two-component system cell cycle response regulator DivK
MESKPQILVVDDYPDGREMVAEYLTYHGFPIREARDGQEAIELAVSWKPSVILMDLQMPGMDGWEVTRRLKADPNTKDILVVALTAHALKREVQAARAAGCDAVVPKPYALSLLADALLRTPEVGPAAFDVPGLGASAPAAPVNDDIQPRPLQ